MQVYPAGIPDAQIRWLGPLAHLYTVQELSQWQVTSADTLCALLNPSDGKWSSAQVPKGRRDRCWRAQAGHGGLLFYF